MTANGRHRRIRQPRCLQDRLHRAAQAAGVSESELARESIDDYLAKESEPALRHVPHRQCTLCITVGAGSGLASDVLRRGREPSSAREARGWLCFRSGLGWWVALDRRLDWSGS